MLVLMDHVGERIIVVMGLRVGWLMLDVVIIPFAEPVMLISRRWELMENLLRLLSKCYLI